MKLRGWLRARLNAALLIILFAATAGCTSGRLALLTQQDGTDLDPVATNDLRQAEDVVVYALAELSGFNVCPPPEVDAPPRPNCAPLTALHGPQWREPWQQILLSGLRIADRECEQYLGALFWFDRAQRRAVNQIGLGAAAAAAIIGLTGGSAETIAIMTTALGLIGASVENIGSGLLYDIGPSSVYEIIEANQSVYKAAIDAELESANSSFDSRPAVMWAIQNYAAICLPPAVETEIRRAVQNADPMATTFEGGIPPTVGQRTFSVTLSREPGAVRVRHTLEDFVMASEENRRMYHGRAVAAGLTTRSFSEFPPIAALSLIADERNSAVNAAIARDLGVGG